MLPGDLFVIFLIFEYSISNDNCLGNILHIIALLYVFVFNFFFIFSKTSSILTSIFSSVSSFNFSFNALTSFSTISQSINKKELFFFNNDK